MCALLLDDLFPVLRVGLYLRFGEWQRAEFFLGECLGLVLGIVGRGVAGLGEREHAQCVRPLVVEADDLQVTAAADHFAFAIGPWHGLHGVIDAERLRAAVDGGLPGDLDIAPAAVGAETEPGDFSSRGQHGFAQGLGNVGAVDGEATGGGQWFGRVESHAPGIGGLLQVLREVDEVHQAQAAVEVGVPVPVFEAGTQRLQRGSIAAQLRGAVFQQVGHDLARHIHFVVHDHVVQVRNRDRPLLQGLQALHGEARARAKADVVLADHWREAGQGRLGVGHPGRVVGVLHVVGALQLRQLGGGENARLRGMRVDVPGAGAAGAVEDDKLQAGPRVAALGEFGGADVGHHRQVHVQALALIIGGHGVDPRDTLQGVHRGL